MIFVHAADLHLGSPLGGLDAREDLPVRTIRQAPMRAFERIADLCEARAAAVLVIAGDLFDGDCDVATKYDAARVIERITKAGTKVVALRGNHDAASRAQGTMPAIEGFHELPTDAPGTIVFEEFGIALHGRGFETQHVDENIASTYPPSIADVLNVGVLHTSLTGAVTAHKQYAPCTVDDLAARGYQYWALGHVHKRQVHSEHPWIIFPGNPQGRDVGETGPRGVTVVEYAGGAVVGMPEHVDVDGVRWHVEEFELVADEDADALLRRVRDRLAELVGAAPDVAHVVRLRFVGRGTAHGELVRDPQAWRGSVHECAMGIAAGDLYIERVVVDTLPQLPSRDELTAREDFIGDAARTLLVGDEAVTSAAAERAFAVLDKKLGQLPAGALSSDLARVETQDIDIAREALLGQLLAVHAAEAEAQR